MLRLHSPEFAHERLKAFLHRLHETFFQHRDDIRTIFESCESIAKAPHRTALATELCWK
jgi:hypothetical protein